MFAGLLQKITGDEEDADDGFVNINDESDDTDVHEQIKSERRRCAFDLNLPIKPLLPFPPPAPSSAAEMHTMYRGLLAEKSAEVALYRDEVDELLGMTRMPTMGLPFVNLKTCAPCTGGLPLRTSVMI